jgi:hypothetical protein
MFVSWLSRWSLSVCTAIILFGAVPLAAALPCTELEFEQIRTSTQTRFQDSRNEGLPIAEAEAGWNSYLTIIQRNPQFAERLHPALASEILADAEMLFFAKNLGKVLVETDRRIQNFAAQNQQQANPAALQPQAQAQNPVQEVAPNQPQPADQAANPAAQVNNQVQPVLAPQNQAPVDYIAMWEGSLRDMLSDGFMVPQRTIEERITASRQPNLENLRRALGELSLSEINELFHGGDPLRPTPDSLIGRYIAETGATTVVRDYDMTVRGNDPGPLRLAVSVSAGSEQAFKKYFYRENFMSVIDHAQIFHGGNYHTYSGGKSEFRFPGSEFKILPMVVLKSTEAQRLTQFLRGDNKYQGWGGRAGKPWEIAGYCARSAYATSCTQKIGNMPIGDRTVAEYRFPGNNEMNPPQPPISQALVAHNDPDPLIRRIWKTPGNEQFSHVIGQAAANDRGEFANPGYTIHTLLGPTMVERVPIVFVFRADHRSPLLENYQPVFENPF